jgi:hypothetical protein
MSLKSRFIVEALLEGPGLKGERPDHRNALGRRERTNVRIILRVVEARHAYGIARSVGSIADPIGGGRIVRSIHAANIVAPRLDGTSLGFPEARRGRR